MYTHMAYMHINWIHTLYINFNIYFFHCYVVPLASVQLEGTDQLEIQIPDRLFNRKTGSASVRNGGKGIPKVRDSRDTMGNNLSTLGEENIPLTGQKTYGNRNQSQSSYVSLHHEPNSLEVDLI